VEQDRDPRAVLLRALLSLAFGGLAAVVGVVRDAPRLDVAVWAVLVPILVAAVLELAPRAQQQLLLARRHRAQVVVPDAVAAAPAAPDPAVQARAAVVAQARIGLLAAKEDGATLEELLALARALHEAELDLARATETAGGHVPQAVRDELHLRDRPTSVPSSP